MFVRGLSRIKIEPTRIIMRKRLFIIYPVLDLMIVLNVTEEEEAEIRSYPLEDCEIYNQEELIEKACNSPSTFDLAWN